jgi:hypothetical protein
VNVSDLITDLLSRYGSDSTQLHENDQYFDSGFRPKAIGMSVPPAMKRLLAKMGWPRTYLSSLEERLDVEGFRLAGQSSANDELWGWWQANSMDVKSGLAHLEALIHGRAYVVVSAPNPNDPLADPNVPIIRVESPKTLYAEVDPATERVSRAIRVWSGPTPLGVPEARVTLYLPNSTTVYRPGPGGWVQTGESVVHNIGVVPVIPLLNKERIDQALGVSEIKPEIRSATDAAARLMMNMQATAELMAIPQRVLFGVDEAELRTQAGGASWDAYIARILAFTDQGSISQFAAAELRNFGEGLEMLRKEVASATGLPPQYFGFQSDNPASADAIRASESRLIKKAERKQRIFGETWEQVMRVAYRVMKRELPKDAHRMETVWRDAATPTFAAMADGVVKLVTAQTPDGRPLVPVEMGRVKMGFSEEELKQMEKWDKEGPRQQLSSLLASPPKPAFKEPELNPRE